MKFSFLLIICLIHAGTISWGQSGSGEDVLEKLKNAEGQVSIETDSLLEANYYKLLIQSSKVKGVPGYRIRIYSESGIGAREQQQRVRARFLSNFPDIDAYDGYDGVYFKVYVGDCRTRSEAIKLQDRINRKFPNSFPMEAYINIQ
ncbi:MAG: SPOR domain-containing protein [Bacteroidetes bacterium]|nr:SPOR domain-containing protein [Bacteroidota bacterium]